MSGFFFNEYPYTDFHELNLSWLIKRIIELNETVRDFVSLNAIKYADPIQWNITTQYEKNVVVIDPNTGIAYLSTQPVPSGVELANEDYWTVIFDLSQLLGNINHNISFHNAGTSPTATFDSAVGDWIIWNGALYEVISPILIGYAYVEDANIKRRSVEDFIGNYQNLLTSDKSNLVNIINEVVNMIGNLDYLSTSDKSNIVNAINDVLATTIGDLNSLSTSDKSSVVNAINDVLSTTIGDLNSLSTSDKSSVVNAINDVLSTVIDKSNYLVHVQNFGAVGDGVTDDTQAFVDAIATSNKGYIFATNGIYNIDPGINLGDNVLIISNATLSNPVQGKILYVNNGNVFSNFQESVTTSPYWQTSPAIKAGGQIMDVGLQIGSANEAQGTSVGTNIYSDGHSDYIALKPSKQLNPVEINLYASEICGELELTNGSNIVVQHNDSWVSDNFFNDLLGLPIHIEGYGTFKITEVISNTSLRVANYDGTTPSFATTTRTFSIVITTYQGIINVSGSNVTRVSGSPFLGYLANPHSVININGNIYSINSVTDAEHLVLNGNAGTLTNVPYKAYGDVEGESTALRINMGAGEQLTIQANKQDNCFYIKTDGGALHKWRDIIIESSNQPNGIVLHADTGKISFRSTFCPAFTEAYLYGDLATEKLATKGSGIVNWNYASDDGPVDINYHGENYGTTYYRDLCVYNGKEGLMLKADGSANEIIFTAKPRPSTPNYINVGDATNTFKGYYAGDGFRFKPTYGLADDSHKLGLDFIKNIVTHTFEYDGEEKQGIDTADLWNAMINHGGDANCTILQNNTIETFEMVVVLVNAIKDIFANDTSSPVTITSTDPAVIFDSNAIYAVKNSICYYQLSFTCTDNVAHTAAKLPPSAIGTDYYQRGITLSANNTPDQYEIKISPNGDIRVRNYTSVNTRIIVSGSYPVTM